jgi:hypothetical protein
LCPTLGTQTTIVTTLKALASVRAFELVNAFSVCSVSFSLPRVVPNPGLEFANAFGVLGNWPLPRKETGHYRERKLAARLIGKINDILGAATNPGMMRYGYLISPLACGLAALLLCSVAAA